MVYQLGDNSPDGMNIGLTSSEKIGFYGATPVVKATITQQATQTVTVLRSDLDGVMDALVALGLVTLS